MVINQRLEPVAYNTRRPTPILLPISPANSDDVTGRRPQGTGDEKPVTGPQAGVADRPLPTGESERATLRLASSQRHGPFAQGCSSAGQTCELSGNISPHFWRSQCMNTVAAATVFKVSDQYRQAPVTGEIHRWIHHSSSERHAGTAGKRWNVQAIGDGCGCKYQRHRACSR